ncbi:hypothetical protein [Streptomyces xanthophaeus]
MSTVDDWKNSSVREGSIVRLRQTGLRAEDRVRPTYLLQPYMGFLVARVRELDYEAGTVRFTVCKQTTAEPLKGEDLHLTPGPDRPYEPQTKKWLEEQGVGRRSELTVTVDFKDFDLLKVIDEDEWPWNGVYVGDYLWFSAPPLGADSGASWQGTVVGLDLTKQLMSVEILLGNGRVEDFRMSRVSMEGSNFGPRDRRTK